MNLKLKLGLSLVGVVTVAVGSVGAMMVWSQRRLLLSEMDRHQTELIQQLAHVCEESLYQNEVVLFNYIKSLKSERGFVGAAFTDNQGKVLNHFQPALIGTTLTSHQEDPLSETNGLFRQRYTDDVGRSVLDLSYPVHFGPGRAGTARIWLDNAILDQFLSTSMKHMVEQSLLICLFALFVGIAGAVMLGQTIIRPIEKIVGHMKKIAHGQLEPMPPLKRKDELGWMANELNITIAKLKELDEMKQEFTSAVTHELRSPLTAIDKFVSLLLKGTYDPLTNNQREVLMTVKNNGVRLAGFVDDLLTTAQLEARRVNVYVEEFDIREVISDIYKLYSPVSDEKKVAFQIEVPDKPLLVWADRMKTHQILTNLVSNAFKFTERGHVKIKAATAGNRVDVVVSDTGPGIPAGEHGKIFEKFFRSPSTAHKFKGTGLGLSIVKSFMDLQKGIIKISNNPGGGLKIHISLPKSSPD